MNSGGQYRDKVQNYHGRPMHCARRMSPHRVAERKRDGSILQTYICGCGHRVNMLFDKQGNLGNEKPTGREEPMQILVTGGTGYFGKGFVKRLLENNLASRICVFSRGEYAQAMMRHELNDDDRLRWFIGDVRDKDRLERAMLGVDVVIHAAALKRLEVAEYNVLECIATNVVGSTNVVRAAIDAGVKKAVLLSTDKACEPCNAYGLSKALAERVFLSAFAYAGERGTRFAVTRYGNVAGSTGSVIPTWRRLMDRQGWVPLTAPDSTRFWMPLSEAIDLVLRTVDTMQGGELNIPELPAYRLEDLAQAMGVNARIVGAHPAEKLHESMIPGQSSEHARRMTVEELRAALLEVMP